MGTCLRCKKEMVVVPEVVITDTGTLRMWTCLSCGDCTDPVILQNRGRQASTKELQSIPKK